MLIIIDGVLLCRWLRAREHGPQVLRPSTPFHVSRMKVFLHLWKSFLSPSINGWFRSASLLIRLRGSLRALDELLDESVEMLESGLAATRPRQAV